MDVKVVLRIAECNKICSIALSGTVKSNYPRHSDKLMKKTSCFSLLSLQIVFEWQNKVFKEK